MKFITKKKEKEKIMEIFKIEWKLKALLETCVRLLYVAQFDGCVI